MTRYFAILLFVISTLFGQTRDVNVNVVYKGAFDATTALSTRPFRSVVSDPSGSCLVSGEVVQNTVTGKLFHCVGGVWVEPVQTGVTSVNGDTGAVTVSVGSIGAAALSHVHLIADITGLQTAIDGKAASNHTHAVGDINSGALPAVRGGLGIDSSNITGVVKMVSGTPSAVAGNASDCVKVDGTSGACGGTSLIKASDQEAQVGTEDSHYMTPETTRTAIVALWQNIVIPDSGVQTLSAASNAIVADRTNIAVSPSSNLTLTSTPTIAAGSNGQWAMITNVHATNSVTLQEEGTLTGSKLAFTLTIASKSSAFIKYDGTLGLWVLAVTGGAGTSLPSDTGKAGQFLSTNGSGTTSWHRPMNPGNGRTVRFHEAANLSPVSYTTGVGISYSSTCSSGTTTPIPPSSTADYFVWRWTTNTVADSQCYWNTSINNYQLFRTGRNLYGEWLSSISSTTEIVWVAGFSSHTGSPSDTDSGHHVVYFRYSTPAGDSNFMCYTNDGTSTGTATSTGVAADILQHRFAIRDAAGTWKFFIDDVQVCGDRTTDIPASGTNMHLYFAVQTKANPGAKSMDWGWAYTEQDH